MGLTVAHIARVEQLSIRRVRQIIADMLASRETRHVVRFVFKPEGGALKIDDISGGSGADAWDLRRIIAPAK